MSDNKDNITFDDCKYSEKYDKMGVTPRELYYRQNKMCHLTVIYDTVEGKHEYGGLFCTDGKEYAPADSMLNPTYECARCLAEFFKKTLEEQEEMKELDKIIVNILTKIGESRALQEGQTELYMSRETFDFVEEHLDNTTMFSPETKPLKVTASGDILMFGSKVNFLPVVEKGTIMVEPGGITLQV